MAKGSFATMQADESSTQITFHYENGHAETLSVPTSSAELGQQLPQMLNQPWLTFHLIDQTISICMAKVLKVEVKPPIPHLRGEAIFPESQRVTALQRGAVGRLGINQ
ncbi:MAG: hypothetical protein HC825_12525 [Oscillatoriales cyanobacterium RM1_1_9]|nr:hypothetical protein [Oscillatoriales cyanobacterium SM2_3_0]NJO45965.1 hypothetical protein [Oscillatoriales cyanobacterium RM2_1_1]NJO72271.1 hypothetical protein [Oscillatoriales cyanobacterium RM1_1_9]